jgi:hypothetical protein
MSMQIRVLIRIRIKVSVIFLYEFLCFPGKKYIGMSSWAVFLGSRTPGGGIWEHIRS